LFLKLKNNVGHISIETYYRYVIADLLPSLDKGLYLDADIIVDGCLSEFYEKNINDYYCSGVEDYILKKSHYSAEIGFCEDELYINAGVLLLNLDRLRKENMSEKLFSNTVKYSNMIQFQDQDIINITLHHKILKAESKFNYCTADFKKRNEAVVIHFTGPKKPWHKNYVRIYEFWKPRWKHWRKYKRYQRIAGDIIKISTESKSI